MWQNWNTASCFTQRFILDWTETKIWEDQHRKQRLAEFVPPKDEEEPPEEYSQNGGDGDHEDDDEDFFENEDDMMLLKSP